MNADPMEEARERRAEQVRAAMAFDPKLLELASAIKSADPTAKLEYLDTPTLKLGKRSWGKELDRAQKVRDAIQKGSVWNVYRYANVGAK